MKIIKLESENIKAVKAVTITPDGNVIKITGKNGQGKTSVLDSILYALAGKTEIPDEVIRRGEEEGKVTLELNEKYIVERSFTKEDSYLKVMSKDGAKYSSPQRLLDEMVGDLTFDPLEFTRLDSKEQAEVLKELVGLDFRKLNMKRKKLYDDRRMEGKYLKNTKGQLKGLKKPTLSETKLETIKASELSEKYNKMQQDYDDRLELNEKIKEYKAEIEELEKKIEEAKRDLDATPLIREVDLKGMKEQLEDVDRHNQRVAEVKKYQEVEEEVAKSEKKYKDFSRKIDEIDDKKVELLKEAQDKMPIGGLSIRNGEVVYNDILFSELSSSEQLKVSLAIAMDSNPELRAILIKDGNLLDSDNMKVIEEMVKEKDYQLFMEVVDDSGEVGIYIEDGEVKKVN